jgi:hypothetical protein
MAGKGRNANSSKPGGSDNGRGGFAEIRFISVALTDAQKLSYAKWVSASPDIWIITDELVASGYKLSVGYDEKSSAYMATITNRNGAPDFLNSCFTLRARTTWEAVARVCWLHSIYGEGDWGQFADPDMGSDIW